jgi:hypothetical protein
MRQGVNRTAHARAGSVVARLPVPEAPPTAASRLPHGRAALRATAEAHGAGPGRPGTRPAVMRAPLCYQNATGQVGIGRYCVDILDCVPLKFQYLMDRTSQGGTTLRILPQ